MHIAKMTDASTPPSSRPEGAEIVAGYIGGDTPHVWTEHEWHAFGRVKKLPVFVRSGPGNGTSDAFAALQQMYRLGVPKGTTVAYDLETQVQGAMVTGFRNALRWAGYRVWIYGSASSVFGNPPCDGYWVADYTGQAFMYPHSKVVATQYEANHNGWDWSEVKDWQYTHRIKTW